MLVAASLSCDLCASARWARFWGGAVQTTGLGWNCLTSMLVWPQFREDWRREAPVWWRQRSHRRCVLLSGYYKAIFLNLLCPIHNSKPGTLKLLGCFLYSIVSAGIEGYVFPFLSVRSAFGMNWTCGTPVWQHWRWLCMIWRSHRRCWSSQRDWLRSSSSTPFWPNRLSKGPPSSARWQQHTLDSESNTFL